MRSRRGRAVRPRLAAALLAASILSACTGENLFTGPVGGGGLLGPEVDITAPQAGISISVGDSVDVTATITSSENVQTVEVTGAFAGGTAAFGPVTATYLVTVRDTTVTYRIGQLGTTTGSVNIAVKATDVLGIFDADTVAITIAP